MDDVSVGFDKEVLREIIADVLDVESSEVTDFADFVGDLEVDSLMALEVVVVLEKRFGIHIQEAEMREINCLDTAYEVLMQKLAIR